MATTAEVSRSDWLALGVSDFSRTREALEVLDCTNQTYIDRFHIPFFNEAFLCIGASEDEDENVDFTYSGRMTVVDGEDHVSIVLDEFQDPKGRAIRPAGLHAAEDVVGGEGGATFTGFRWDCTADGERTITGLVDEGTAGFNHTELNLADELGSACLFGLEIRTSPW